MKGSIESKKPRYDNHDIDRKNLITLAKDGIIELKTLKDKHEKLIQYLEVIILLSEKFQLRNTSPIQVRKTEVDKEKVTRPN